MTVLVIIMVMVVIVIVLINSHHPRHILTKKLNEFRIFCYGCRLT